MDNTVGCYRILRLIGRGGQGSVYLGYDSRLQRRVAIKIYRMPNRRKMRKALLQEARIIADIQSPQVVKVHDIVESVSHLALVMEYVPGCSLEEYLSRVRPSVASTVRVGLDIASALALARRRRIVHGDIKPANIMLKRSGHAKLIDMGSAIDFHNPPRDRECTPLYAAPEVLEDRTSTPRSDLASVGYVLIELLSGVNPFGHKKKLRDLLQAKRELPSQLSQILPDEISCNELLMNFLQGLIAPDPNRRFPSAEAAEHVDKGAAAFHRQLIMGDMATEYDNDIRVWLEELRRLESDLTDVEGVPTGADLNSIRDGDSDFMTPGAAFGKREDSGFSESDVE